MSTILSLIVNLSLIKFFKTWDWLYIYADISTIWPLFGVATLTASIENITGNYIPHHKTTLTVLSIIVMVILVVILYESIKHWVTDLKSGKYDNTPENSTV